MRVRRRQMSVLAAVSAAAVVAQLGGAGSASQAAVRPLVRPIAAVGAAPRAASTPAVAAVGSGEVKADYDAREGATPAAQQALRDHAAQLEAQPSVQAFAHTLGTQSILDIDPATGTPSQVSRLDGLLTGPSSASASSVALGYVRAHPEVFRLSDQDLAGFSLARDYVDVAGIHHLSYTQTAGGLPVFGNGIKANVTKDGRLISIGGSPAVAPAAPAAVTGGITAAQAVAVAKSDVGDSATATGKRDVVTPVAFVTAGTTHRAWQTITMSSATPMLTVVDAQTGRVLYRDHLADDFEPASDTPSQPGAAAAGDQYGLAFGYYPGAAAGGRQTRVDLTSPGWLPAGASQLSGNNVHTYSDVNDDNADNPGEGVHPQSTGGDFLYPFQRFTTHAALGCDTFLCDWAPNQPYSWRTNRKQTAVNNFVLINRYHDYLKRAPIGFTEAAGNFQKVNTTGQGKGGDAVIDQPLDGADTADGLPDPNHIDNANFATPPDGTSPTMQMYLWHEPGTSLAEDPFIPSSGADDASIVLHEYTHGLSHRLVVDADDVPALDSQQGGSMGEAWSDYYALDYLANKSLITDDPSTADVVEGQYVTGGPGIRTEPIDCKVDSPASQCPGGYATGPGGYTYGDFGKVTAGPEVHADGEIWAQTLWQLRTAIGPTLADSLITRGMELSPTYPSYLDMRNAIILADQAIYSGTHVKQLWSIFASRGMGFFAGTIGGDDTAPVEDFSVPPAAGTPTGSVTGTVTDSSTGDPVSGVTVAFGGHDSGLPGADWATTTDDDGTYTLDGVTAGTYPDVYTSGAGYDQDSDAVSVGGGSQATKDWALTRDWAASSGGATVRGSNGNEFTPYGCGPAADLDQSLGTGWSANLPTSSAGKYFVVKLPVAVDLSSIQIDPANTCGDGGSASTADYKVETSTDGTTFKQAASGTFTVDDRHHLNAVTRPAGAARAGRSLRFSAYTTQVGQIGGTCPGNYSGCEFIDSSELEAFGTPAG